MGLYPEIAKAYGKKIKDAEGITEGEVVTVFPLDQESLENLAKTLSTMTGKEVKLTQREDKSILGGFVVKIGNYLVDLSLKSKLDALTANVSE